MTRADWASDPFSPVMCSGSIVPQSRTVDWRTTGLPFDPEWRFYGRAVADDKASITAFIAAFDALRSIGRPPDVNIRVFWEGEEEVGSPHLETVLRANADLLKADLWLFGDDPIH